MLHSRARLEGGKLGILATSRCIDLNELMIRKSIIKQ